jgi:hypothetical protein
MRQKIKVLLLTADPFPETALRLGREVKAIDNKIQKAGASARFDLRSHVEVEVQDIQDLLLRHRPQIVHFAGHGDGSGGIVVGDELGQPKKVARVGLDATFRALENPPRVIILNACGRLTANDPEDYVVDVMIEMNDEISDVSAIYFAESFYGALAADPRTTLRKVETAFKLGVARLKMEDRPDAMAPVLRIRPGVDPEALL